MLAGGTGGFVIANTNDLLGGLERIGKEQNEYYVLAYTPPESVEGSCHTLRGSRWIAVEPTSGRAAGTATSKPVDLLAGKPVEQDLENRATGSQPGTVYRFHAGPVFLYFAQHRPGRPWPSRSPPNPSSLRR